MGEFWNSFELHSDLEQLKRQKSAQDKKLTPINYDAAKKIGFFKGSSKTPYTTTLDDCSCGDFIRRRQPCKHMYRLAHELSIFNLGEVKQSNTVVISSGSDLDEILDKSTGEISEQINLDGAKHVIDTLNLDELIILENLFETFEYHDRKFVLDDCIADYKNFANKNLCIVVNAPLITHFDTLLKADLLSILEKINTDDYLRMKSKCLKKELVTILTTTYGSEVANLFPASYFVKPNKFFINDYKKLLFHTRKCIDKNFMETEYCLECFENKFNVELSKVQYLNGAQKIPFHETRYVICSTCGEKEIIRVNKDLIETELKLKSIK